MLRKWILTLVIASLLMPFSCFANTFTDKLHKVMSQIHVTKENLSRSEKEHRELQDRLRKHDTDIGSLTKKIAKTKNELINLRKNLKGLNSQQKVLQKNVEENQAALTEQLKSAYMLGNKNTIKMLLNQENPNDFDRMSTYHRIIGKSRYELINNLNKTLSTINKNRHKIKRKTNTLAATQKKLINQEKEMHLSRRKRRNLLINLNRSIRTHRQKLIELDNNKKRLEATISRLKENKENTTEYFLAHRYNLPWPTKGKIEVPFGTRIQNSHLKWNGVLMNAKEGERVLAIAPGKVVFSNWMPGFGLLLIIDHGDGFMSLYGRNNSIYRSTEDLIKTGDLIASVGMSGGHSKPALYFSLRHKGKPLDPTEWCKTLGKTA